MSSGVSEQQQHQPMQWCSVTAQGPSTVLPAWGPVVAAASTTDSDYAGGSIALGRHATINDPPLLAAGASGGELPLSEEQLSAALADPALWEAVFGGGDASEDDTVSKDPALSGSEADLENGAPLLATLLPPVVPLSGGWDLEAETVVVEHPLLRERRPPSPRSSPSGLTVSEGRVSSTATTSSSTSPVTGLVPSLDLRLLETPARPWLPPSPVSSTLPARVVDFGEGMMRQSPPVAGMMAGRERADSLESSSAVSQQSPWPIGAILESAGSMCTSTDGAASSWSPFSPTTPTMPFAHLALTSPAEDSESTRRLRGTCGTSASPPSPALADCIMTEIYQPGASASLPKKLPTLRTLLRRGFSRDSPVVQQARDANRVAAQRYRQEVAQRHREEARHAHTVLLRNTELRAELAALTHQWHRLLTELQDVADERQAQIDTCRATYGLL